ncbi:hypothetical protein [Halobaculum sp. P14]|uniref:hypothetical protein n=1 Tax=Halobaculum sp. P14 TaxID=3421638 RepID=UPI003EBBEB40
MTLTESLVDAVSDNLRTLIVVAVGYVAAVEMELVSMGYPELPSLPGWWQLVVLAAIAVAVVGWIVGSKLAELLPDPVGTILVAQEAHDATGGAIYELNDEAWQQLEVVDGELYPWSASPHDVYECRRFNPDTWTAVANWKGTKPASELSSQTDRDEIMRQIRELREEHEQEARYGRMVRQSLPSLLRALDKRRAQAMNAALEDTVSPTWDDKPIDEMIADRVPDRALPDYMRDDEDSTDDADEELVSIDLLDDEEAFDPASEIDGATDPLRNDGGSEP